ncbi:MAG: hypothetical protein K6C95_08145, partial [Lachnospiraceae bacterium]|nr:hypothetical protein [Lachnospiraceae bacterium]
SFSPEYKAAVVRMLRKMEQMKILKADVIGEEPTKVYAFHQLVKAQDDLMEAVRSKDRERIAKATAHLKEVRQGMDELMQIARDNFNPTEYMGNLDVVRSGMIPWDYARDVVHGSQINSLYMLGSAMLKYGITIDEFEKDPGAAIQEFERRSEEKGNSMKGLCEGKSAGVLAAHAATGIIPCGMQAMGNTPHSTYMRGVGGLILADPGKDPMMRRRNDVIYQHIHEFDANLNTYREESSKLLKEGLKMRSERGRDAFRTLMIVDMSEADPDRMFADPPIAPDGTRTHSITLEEYLRGKNKFDYRAQVGHMDAILTDAAKETERLARICAEGAEKHSTPAALADFSRSGFKPYQMLKARQEALIQLLVTRANDKDQPGFAALEDELRHMPEKYEALRKSKPELNLPALTEDQKQILNNGARIYDDLTINRTAAFEAEEKRIAKAEADRDKEFNRTLSDLNKTVSRRRKTYNDLTQRGASNVEIDAAEVAYINAYNQRDVLIKGRAKAIADAYMAGTMPEAYAKEKLQQLAEMSTTGNGTLRTPPLFGDRQPDAAGENARLSAREKFLSGKLCRSQGILIGQPKNYAAGMVNALDALGLMPAQEEPVQQPVNVQQVQNEQLQQVQNVQPQQHVNEQMPKAKVDEQIKDKSFADLEKQLLGDRPQQDHRQRRGSVSVPVNRPQMEDQAGQRGPKQNP